MKLTDEGAIKALKKARVMDLEEMIDDYPEKERDGRSDWEMLANEAGWLYDSFNDEYHANHEALEAAHQLIRDSRNGKKTQHKEYEIQEARELVNMQKRLATLVKKLQAMGLHCPHC